MHISAMVKLTHDLISVMT